MRPAIFVLLASFRFASAERTLFHRSLNGPLSIALLEGVLLKAAQLIRIHLTKAVEWDENETATERDDEDHIGRNRASWISNCVCFDNQSPGQRVVVAEPFARQGRG